MSVNPYQSSSAPVDQSARAQEGSSASLHVLCILVAVHLVILLACTIIGLLAQIPTVMIGGLVSTGFHIAILVGLVRKAEWARVCLIWFCYVGLMTYAFQLQAATWLIIPLAVFELVTLVIAHSSAVRRVTRGASVAVSYTYNESAQDTARSTSE